MRARIAVGSLVFILISISLVGASNGADNVEELIGTVLAYDHVKSSTPCYKKECEGSLIVRVDISNEKLSRYVRIDFRYSQDNPPKQLVASQHQWRFRLIRTKNLDEPISEFIQYETDSYGRDRKLPIWKIVPGAEGQKLPFGESLPSYLMKRNGFKLIS